MRILFPAGVIMSVCGCYMWNLLYLHGFIRFSDGFLPHYLYCMWDFMVYDRVFEIGPVDPIIYRRNSFFYYSFILFRSVIGLPGCEM